MNFPSKKDIFYTIIIWGMIVFIVFIYLIGGQTFGFQIISYRDPLGYVLGGMTTLVLLWIWFGTGYKIRNGSLYIQSGPFRKQINVQDITRVQRIKSPLSAPALSIKKLEVQHKNYKSTLISPENEKQFIQMLSDENPDIELHK